MSSTAVPPAPGRGLYGSDLSASAARTGTAELVGTAVLVFVGTATACHGRLGVAVGGGYEVLTVALAFGLVLVALVAALGHVSGCHLNPAITLGLAATGRFPWRQVPVYLAAQVLGAVLGALATWATLGGAAREEAQLAVTTVGDTVPGGRAVLVEALVTFVLVLVVVSVATDERVHSAAAPAAVGFALAAAILVAAPLTGGAVNPARSLGPALVAGELAHLWVYVLGPVAGGVLAALLYDRVLARAEPPA
ncbi:MIP/aquaporin family protein [Vallicoccus soli]|uniref:MIP family channel protein n=1 Tax=Vallicoccus soli TaxID=2339232 RepID=A0A3A3YWW6_9ACTN|nr:MIP family channel protein [Vallicoccus soli]RJK96057.1 MIP family channel protein [Vallicoccus soli]